MKKELTEKQELIFRQHNDAKGFFFTSDDQAFAKEGDCNNHKHTLEDKDTQWIDNPYYRSGENVQKVAAGENTFSDQAKEEKKLVKALYIEVLGKNPAPQYDVAKMRELIAAKQAENNN